jgi:hypothetical protein
MTFHKAMTLQEAKSIARHLGHLAWMPANFISMAHFSVSSAVNLPKSGENVEAPASPIWQTGGQPRQPGRRCSGTGYKHFGTSNFPDAAGTYLMPLVQQDRWVAESASTTATAAISPRLLVPLVPLVPLVARIARCSSVFDGIRVMRDACPRECPPTNTKPLGHSEATVSWSASTRLLPVCGPGWTAPGRSLSPTATDRPVHSCCNRFHSVSKWHETANVLI